MPDNIVHITHDSYDAEIAQATLPVVIDFWAPWCGPCKAIGPVLEELADQYEGKVKVVKVNVDEEPTIAGAFQVKSIPTLAVVKDQRVIEQQVGFKGRGPLEQLFANLAS